MDYLCEDKIKTRNSACLLLQDDHTLLDEEKQEVTQQSDSPQYVLTGEPERPAHPHDRVVSCTSQSHNVRSKGPAFHLCSAEL